jgi:hypothetical protein
MVVFVYILGTICCPVDCGTACKLPVKPPGSSKFIFISKLITRRSEEQDNTTMLFFYITIPEIKDHFTLILGYELFLIVTLTVK